MPPQLPNPAQQAAQRAIQANELARTQQLARERARSQQPSHQRRNSSGIRGVGLILRVALLIAFLVILVLIVTTGLSIVHGRSAP